MEKMDGRTFDHKTLEDIKLLAVRRVVEDGESPGEVMKSLGFSRTAIYPWLRRFEEGGWAALVEQLAQGRNPDSVRSSANQSGVGSSARIPGHRAWTMVCGAGGSSEP
jgi:transposase-like protein